MFTAGGSPYRNDVGCSFCVSDRFETLSLPRWSYHGEVFSELLCICSDSIRQYFNGDYRFRFGQLALISRSHGRLEEKAGSCGPIFYARTYYAGVQTVASGKLYRKLLASLVRSYGRYF